jgi:hypothetical protein
MVWPHDPLRQAQRAATDGVRLLDFAREGATDELREAMVARLADKLGVSRTTLRSDPWHRHLLELLYTNTPRALRRTTPVVEQSLIISAGGYSAAAVAPSATTLNSEVLKAINGAPRNAGLILLTVRKLDPEFGYAQSLNNACRVLAETPPEDGGLGIDARRLKEDHWDKFRSVAPLWAGMIAEVEFGSGSTFRAATFQRELRALMLDRTRLLRALRWALSLRSFAANHRSEKSKNGSSLLPSHAAIDLRVRGLSASQPTLHDLPERALAHAKKARSRLKAASTIESMVMGDATI